MSQSSAKSAALKAEDVAHKSSELLSGRLPGDNPDKALGHPIHPATVHWPIAFLSSTFALAGLSRVPNAYYPFRLLPAKAALPALAHYTAVAGVVTAFPAIITGLGEAYELMRTQYQAKGSWSQVLDDAWYARDIGGKKVKTTITHASMNDLVVALAAWNWWRGYKYPGQPLPTLNVVLGLIALPGLFYSAMLGGKLVYEYAVGVQRQGSGKAEKEKAQ